MKKTDSPIICIDRCSRKTFIEDVFGGKFLRFSIKKRWIREPLAKIPLFSSLFALYQRAPWTKRAIIPFVKRFNLDPNEFEKDLQSFTSFEDFFIRRLKKEARPIAKDNAVIPADGRYLFIPNMKTQSGIYAKGKTFSLEKLLGDTKLAKKFQTGTAVIGRLAPPDYHRFHFAVEGIPDKASQIKGSLYSVNPWSLRERIEILTENKRMITKIETKDFGQILAIEVGATNVGSINQTYLPEFPVKKGQEKGYFSFGGSLLILLFQERTIQLAPDLLELSDSPYEIRCLMGQALGKKII